MTYIYTENDWEGFQPHEVKAQMKNQFGCFIPELWALYERYMARCRDYQIGRNRIVFISDKYVVKLPWTNAGVADNDWEGSVSNIPDAPYNDYQVIYARTRLHYEANIPVLFMERVEYMNTDDIKAKFGREPEWVGYVDCGQVGLSRTGKLVAYDYGIR